MACLRKRNRKKGFVCIVDYYDNNGQRHWFKTKTSNRKLAEQIKVKIEVDLNMDSLGIPKGKIQ